MQISSAFWVCGMWTRIMDFTGQVGNGNNNSQSSVSGEPVKYSIVL